MTNKIRSTVERPPVSDKECLAAAKADAESFLEMMAKGSLTPRGERDYGRVTFMLLSMLRTIHKSSDAEARGIIEKQVRQLLVALYEAEEAP